MNVPQSGSAALRGVKVGKLLCACSVLLSLAACLLPRLLASRAALALVATFLLVALVLARLGASFWISGLSAAAPRPIAWPERTRFLAAILLCVTALAYGFTRLLALDV